MNDSLLSLDDLLPHAAWVRRLAQALVQDAAEADDLAQEIWLSALRSSPRGENPRGWLRTVARRLAGHRRRSGEARGRREASAARPEALPPTEELAARAERQREVAALVLELDEPLRRVLLLRFWEGLPPREIATREGLPLDTVKTRLQRGKLQLRRRLEAEHGKERWALFLAPLLDGERAAVVPLSSGAGVELILGSVLALAAGIGIGARLLGGDGKPPAAVEGTARLRQAPEDEALLSTAEVESEGIEPAPTAATDLATSVPAPGTERVVPLATLVDAQGRPLGGFRLRLPGPFAVRWQGGDPVWVGNAERTLRIPLEEQERLGADPVALEELCAAQAHPEEWLATLAGRALPEREFVTAADGTFPLDLDHFHDLEVVEPGWTRLASGHVNGAHRIVAGPRIRLAGWVLDGDGEPVPGATVRWVPASPEQALALNGTFHGPPECRSDPVGRFVLRDVPWHATGRLFARSSTHSEASLAVPSIDTSDLRVELAAPSPDETRLTGRVVDETGRPLAGARVHLGFPGVATDQVETRVDGTFELTCRHVLPSLELVVWHVGYLPYRVPSAGRSLLVGSGGAPHIEVVLERGLAELAGQVVDERNTPLAGVEVGLLEPTLLIGTSTSLEESVGGRSLTVTTDGEGRFRLTGLLGGPVRLRLFDPSGPRMRVTGELDPGAVLPPLVLDDAGELGPLRVWVILADEVPESLTAAVGFPWLQANGEDLLFERGERGSPDADGAFQLEHVPAEHGWIEIAVNGAPQLFPVEDLEVVDGEVTLRADGSP